MTTGNIVSFTGEDAYQVYLGTHQDTGSKLSAMSQTVGLTPDSSISIGNGFFTKIYSGYQATRDFTDGLATEADNIKSSKDQQQEIKTQQQENEKKAEEQRDGVSAANSSFKDYQEQQENKMREINGRHFSDADLEETINEIIEDKEAFQKKHNLTDEQADLALEHAMIMQGMTRDERETYLKKLSETEPEIANAIADDAVENHKSKLENKNNSPVDNEISNEDLDEGYAELADLELDNDDLNSMAELVTKAEQSELVQNSYADSMEAIKKSNIALGSQEPQRVTEVNEVTPVTPKGMTLGG